MLYKFKSKATGDLIMLEPNGAQLLDIVGKDARAQGHHHCRPDAGRDRRAGKRGQRDGTDNRHNHDAFAAEDHADEAERIDTVSPAPARRAVHGHAAPLAEGQGRRLGCEAEASRLFTPLRCV